MYEFIFDDKRFPIKISSPWYMLTPQQKLNIRNKMAQHAFMLETNNNAKNPSLQTYEDMEIVDED